MIGFVEVRTVEVPRALALAAHAHLARAGLARSEGFALWAGRQTGETFAVHETVIPEQQALRFADGVCVRVDADELDRINRWLFANRLALIAQLHSHPADAYHSDTDDHYPIVTTVGGLSLVVPNFARHPFSLGTCAVYRLLPRRGWVELPRARAARLIRIVG